MSFLIVVVLCYNFSSNVIVTLTVGEFTPDNNKNGFDGETKTGGELTQAFYESIGYEFVNIWKWENNKPYLRNEGYMGTLQIP